jgi:hypothetical protein
VFPRRASRTLSQVCAVVGAWGNIGAVCWGMMFKFKYITNLDHGYEVLGYIVMASAVMSAFVRIKGHSHMLGTLE